MSLTPITSWIKPLNEAFTISAGGTQSFSAQDLVGDDEGVNGSIIRLESVGNAAHGTIKLIDGQYVYTPAAGFTGDDRFSYTVTDQFGNRCTETVEVHVNAVSPAGPTAVLPPVITDVMDDTGASTGKVSSGGRTDDTLPTLKGTGEPGSTITIYDGGTKIGTAVTGADWQWTFTPTTALPAGSHVFTAVGSHADGSGATPAVYAYNLHIGADVPAPTAAAVLPPVITDITDNVGTTTGRVADGGTTDDRLPTLKGTGEPGSTITLYDNGVKIGTTVTGADWQWSFTPAQALPAGVHAFTAVGSHADGSGATRGVYAYTVNLGDSVVLIGPQVEIIEDGNNDGTLAAAELRGALDIKVTLPATAKAGDTLSLSDQAGHKVERLLTGADISAKVLNLVDAFPVPAQGQTFTVKGELTDVSGNCSPMAFDSAVISAAVSPVPGAPTVAITTDANNDGVISRPEMAARASVKVSLPAGAKAGDTLTVADADGHIAGRILSPADITAGQLTLANIFPLPAEGTALTVRAQLITASGVVSPFGTDSATVDLSAPSAPTVTLTTDDNNDGTFSKAELDAHQGVDVKIGLPVDARAGDLLTVVDQAGHKLEKVLTPADITARAVTLDNAFPAPADGQPVKVSATVSDPAGNVSPQGTDAATVRTSAPGVGVVIVDDRNNDGTLTRTEIAGASRVDVRVDLPDGVRVGDQIEVKDQAGHGVTKTLTGADVANHQVTFLDAFPLPASGATIAVSARITDTAGNVSPVATDQATYDGNHAPVSVNDTNAVKGYVAGATQQQGVSATGNVLANDTDTDGPAAALRVAGASSSAATLQPGTGVESVLEGRYGHLTVHADGSYSYVSDKSAGLTSAVDDVFYYLSKDASGAVSGDPARLTIHVEPPFAQVLSVSSPTVAEGGNLDFTVTTSNAGSPTPITLALQSGTATVGTDTGTPVQVNFGQGWVPVVGNVVNAPAGTTAFQVRVPATDDTLAERTEQFSLSVSTPAGSRVSGTGAITDNDLGGAARGVEDTPLVLTADNFHITAGQKLVIDALPADGKLQYNNAGTWTSVSAGQEIAKADIDAGKLRFVPDADESGIDAYNAPGTGNLKSDYARAGYSLVDTGSGDRISGGTLAIDISPVADLGTLKATMSGIKVLAGPAGLVKSDAQGSWWQYKFALSGASPDQDGSESQWVAISKMVNVSGRHPKLFHADGTQVLPDATGLLWVKASETVYVDNPGYTTTITYQIGERELNSAGQVLHQVLGGTKTVSMVSPLVLDLDGDGVQTTDMAEGTRFDLLGDGHATQTGWVSGQDGLLAMDLDGNGRIDSGAELFGEGTRLAGGAQAQDGFQALSAQDTNHDGQITPADAAFAQLQVWQDANSDGVTQNGELHGLTALGISALGLQATASDAVNNGNSLGLIGSYTTTDGVTHQMADVWFATAGAVEGHAGLDAQGASLDQLLAQAGLTEAKPAAPAARPDAAAHDTHHSAPAAPADLHTPASHDWAH